ncbi:hypothetical protein TPA0910_22480 [Streptomyces hygroscopicus subsp. sporocinereus]|uniref:Integral membrane protein n=1 Tax=Streptomyces hygroscopicus TaxID=1912 RepID=A0ABQ3TWW1_STRHY|nr:hypothetical protein [Streptomyces hygroscopicus]GHJ27815.1 hypothetical protein TPA0910_22480 [Streptomyces hygroscopicus]
MRHHEPPTTPGTIAPHIPADLYRHLDGRPVVIIQPPAPTRSVGKWAVPLALGLAGAAGVLGLVAAAVAVFDYAARTAAFIGSATGPLGLGLSLKLFGSKNK